MANFYLDDPTYNTLHFDIEGLGADWNTTNYTKIVISTGSTTSGSTTPPGGILATIYPPSSGTSRDISGWLANLTPDTTYPLYCYAKTPAEGKYYFVGMDTETTDDPPVPDYPLLDSENDRYMGGFTVETDDNSDGCDYFRFRLKEDGGSYTYYNQSSKYFTKAAGSLKYGQRYYIGVCIVYDGEYSSYSTDSAITTRAKEPTITEYDTTATSIKIKVSGLEDTWDKCYVNLYNSSGTLLDGSKYTTVNNGIIEFTGLDGGTTYKFKGRTWVGTNSVLCSDYTDYLSVETDARPTNFSWASSTISSGEDARISASDWNALASKINEFRVYKGLSQDSFTTVSAGNSIYASQFNELRNSIADMRTTGLASTKSTGDYVYASDIDSLRTTLNAIP